MKTLIRLPLLILASLALSELALGADAAGIAKIADQHYDTNARAILTEFDALLAIPNHAANRADMERNLVALEKMLTKRALKPRRLEAPGAVPALYGETPYDPEKPTLLWYAHYDG